MNGQFVKTSADLAVDGVADLLKGKNVIGIGSARASLESNFALKRLVGANNFSTGERAAVKDVVDLGVALLRHEAVHQASLAQIETADGVFILGEDLPKRQTVLPCQYAKRLRIKPAKWQSALKLSIGLLNLSSVSDKVRTVRFMWRVADTKLSDIAKVSAVATPDDIAKLGFMVGDVIKAYADTLDEIGKSENAIFAKEKQTDLVSDDEMAMQFLAHHIAYDLIMANRPLVVTGTSLTSKAIVQAAGYIAQTLTAKRAKIAHVEREFIEVQNAKIRDEVARQFIDPDKGCQNGRHAHHRARPNDFEKELSSRLLKINTLYADKTGVYVAMPEANSDGCGIYWVGRRWEVLAQAFGGGGRVRT